MKRIFLILGTFATGAVAFCVLNARARSQQRELRQSQTRWMEQTQTLAQVQADAEILSARVRELKERIPPLSRDAALIALLSTNDFNGLSLENQARLLGAVGATARPTDSYVIVPKTVLGWSQVRAFNRSPDAGQLTSAGRQTLAINSDEQKGVESAFADALKREGDWAQAHVLRSGASNDMLVSYTIPIDPNFARDVVDHLYANVSNVLGAQRTALLQRYFDNYRVYEDGAMAVNTNKLEVWRVPGKEGLFYRAGWEMGSWSAINTLPEPIRADRFPAAFRLIFPGGWQELAQREGLDWVDPAAENK